MDIYEHQTKNLVNADEDFPYQWWVHVMIALGFNYTYPAESGKRGVFLWYQLYSVRSF